MTINWRRGRISDSACESINGSGCCKTNELLLTKRPAKLINRVLNNPKNFLIAQAGNRNSLNFYNLPFIIKNMILQFGATKIKTNKHEIISL